MTLRYAEVIWFVQQMDLQTALAVMNLVAALGAAISGLISWWRGGVVAVFIKNIGRIEKIQDDVDEINKWKDKTDTLLVALALGNKRVDDRKAMEQIGMKTNYKDLMDEERKENGNKDKTD